GYRRARSRRDGPRVRGDNGGQGRAVGVRLGRRAGLAPGPWAAACPTTERHHLSALVSGLDAGILIRDGYGRASTTRFITIVKVSRCTPGSVASFASRRRW